MVIDQAVRRSLTPEKLEALGRGAGLIVIGDSLESEDVIEAARIEGLDHLIADGDEDDAELVVTSVKLLSGDIFGLEKYLSWGARVSEQSVKTYEDKREAMAVVSSYAKEVGARRPVVSKIESVVDELLMNALYDAPVVAAESDADGTLPPDAIALLRWACDGRYFAVSVEDSFGVLHKESILDHLVRARQERGRPRPSTDGSEGTGAGLGLYFILSSVTRFIVNVAPGRRTEVVCLFDLKQNGRDAEACARSLHVFGDS